MADEVVDKVPAILSSMLGSTDIVPLLRNKFKMRVSETTVPGTIIFPLSGVTCMVAWLQKNITDGNIGGSLTVSDSILHDRIKKMTDLHKQCYVLCIAAQHSDQEHQTLYNLQTSFLHDPVQFLPLHNVREAVEAMSVLAKACLKKSLEDNQFSAKQLLESTNKLEPSRYIGAFKAVGLSTKEADSLMNGFQQLCQLSQASLSHIKTCGLSEKSMKKLISLMEKQPSDMF